MEKRNKEDRLQWLLQNVPTEVDTEDSALCKILLDTELETLQDLIKFFATADKETDERTQIGPLKFQYEEGDSYDWHAAMGCLNCGASYDIYDETALVANPNMLVCTQCGYVACPRHEAEESDAMVDILENQQSAGETEQSNDILNVAELSASGVNTSKEKSIYLHGTRKQHFFGEATKLWWLERFLPEEYRLNRIHHQLRVVDTVHTRKGETCKEECEKCGHDEAFFHCFQARSSDEGMTIMYECCACGARKVFNN